MKVICSPWNVQLTAPIAGTVAGQFYDGTLAAKVTVPSNSVALDMSAFAAGCSSVGPWTAKTFLGSYDAGVGAMVVNTNQVFTMASTGCTFTSFRLASASFTLDPILDLQW